MTWLEILRPALEGVLVAFAGGGTGWLFARRQNKAETAKTLAEARLTDANAERVANENKIEVLVTESVAEIKKQVGENSRSIAQIGEAVALIKHEVLPNTGTSMNDAVKRTEAAVTELRGEVDILHEKQDLSAQDRKDLHRLLESESLRQRERELDARREHDEFREQIRQLKDCSQN